jgi:hypothetical protein
MLGYAYSVTKNIHTCVHKHSSAQQFSSALDEELRERFHVCSANNTAVILVLGTTDEKCVYELCFVGDTEA